jgi:hypothetical protein
MLSPGIWTDESVRKLSYFARLVYIGLISNADDAGKMRGESHYIKACVFPYDEALRVTDVELALKAISAEGLIVRWTTDAGCYLQHPHWKRHQYIREPQPSHLPDFKPSPAPTAPPTPPSTVKEGKDSLVEKNTAIDLQQVDCRKALQVDLNREYAGAPGYLMGLVCEGSIRKGGACESATCLRFAKKLFYAYSTVATNKGPNDFKTWELMVKEYIG